MRLRRYVRRRLRRRLFVWFGVSIAFSGLLTAALVFALSPASSWKRYVEDGRKFVSGRFSAVWDVPAQREELARAVASDLHVGVTLHDPGGQLLASFGPSCVGPYAIPVVREGQTLGEARMCLPEEGRGPGATPLALIAGALVLWGASGFIAHRLTRPLTRLIAATRAIGAGDLDVEITLGRHEVDELQELAVSMREMAKRIGKQITDQRELLAAVSHEIRTPLGHLRVLVDLARDSGADASRLAEIEAEVLAIDAIVARLIASSRLEFGTLDPRPLDAVQLALHALDRAGLDPTLLEASAENLPLVGDAALIGQALANLLRNADEHGGGVTGLSVRATQDAVQFEVLDEGPGLGDLSANEAFAAFTAGASRRGGSLGLGLSLVRRIAAAHGGEAWARDRDNAGASVGFSCEIGGPRSD